MSEQAVSPTSNTEARVFIGVAATFAVFCVSTLAGLTYYQFNHERVPVVRHGDMGASMLGAIAVTPDDGYSPTSAYIEEGADSDVTKMGFDKNSPEGSGKRISDNDVQDVMYDHQNDLLECYIEGLEEDPEMAGRVDFHFRIKGDGGVAMVQITRSGLHDKATEDCLVDSARRWDFPSTGAAALAKFDTDFTFATE